MTIETYIKKSLADEWRNLDKEMKKVEAAQRDENPPRFHVRIHSFWSDEGEEDTSATGKNLESAIKLAEERFLEKNSRPDVQGQYFVFVRVGEIDFSVPSTFWDNMILRNKGKK